MIRRRKRERGGIVRTLTMGAEVDEVSDCLRLEIVAGAVADAGKSMLE